MQSYCKTQQVGKSFTYLSEENSGGLYLRHILLNNNSEPFAGYNKKVFDDITGTASNSIGLIAPWFKKYVIYTCNCFC